MTEKELKKEILSDYSLHDYLNGAGEPDYKGFEEDLIFLVEYISKHARAKQREEIKGIVLRASGDKPNRNCWETRSTKSILSDILKEIDKLK